MDTIINVISYLIATFIVLGIPILIVAYFIYEYKYYKSDKFLEIKNRLQDYISECNELNNHIEVLKNSSLIFKQTDYGQASNIDYSRYNYQRRNLKNFRNNMFTCNCSLQVCRNAQQQPFKYLCKYFNINTDEETLNKIEEVLNNFSAAEQGKYLLKNKKDIILNGIWNEVPWPIKIFGKKKFANKLGFEPIDLSQLYFPTYSFNYISSGGNSAMRTNIVLDINNLNKFVDYMSGQVKFRKSVAGQRALMTSSLREKIKIRDKYTCKHCGNSTNKEPNLLLEIDHIVPLSKGGITSEENLQTLCWKCNRSKGAKIDEREN